MHDRMIPDGGSACGSISVVRRIGATVIRPAGPWTPAVHALLRHLEHAGFNAAPRVLGRDRDGAEIVSYLDGLVAMRPWPPALHSLDGLTALGSWLAGYHRAVRDFTPPADAHWRADVPPWTPGMIVRHGDLGPWNTVWQDGALIGVIDWDLAEPGHAIDDIAQLAWFAVPLQHDGPADLDIAERFRHLCRICDAEPAAVIDALLRLQNEEIRRTLAWGTAGTHPWTTFLARGDVERTRADIRWLESQCDRLAP